MLPFAQRRGDKHEETGEGQAFFARTIILGTGGFASNLDMVYTYRPDLRRHRVLEGSHIGATGNGHRMVQRIGGVLTHRVAGAWAAYEAGYGKGFAGTAERR